MIKIIWALIGLNTLALLIFIGAYFVFSNGRNVDYQEKGWTFILAGLGLIVILLAAIPLRYSQSTGVLILSGIFAALPLGIFAGIFISKKVNALKKQKTFAETYYQDKIQRSIASSIENNDTAQLKELIKEQNVNVKGTTVWDEEGLTYLQFAIRLRSNPISFPFNDEANIDAIKILIANGAAPTPALAEATTCLTPDKLLLLINAGADLNSGSFASADPLLFQVIGKNDKIQNDIAILLIQNGADVNAKNMDGYTPSMWAAYRAGTSENWTDTWRFLRYLLEDAKADYTYTANKGISLGSIIKNIREEAKEKNIAMPPDFNAVVRWLQQRNVSTEPSTKLKAAI